MLDDETRRLVYSEMGSRNTEAQTDQRRTSIKKATETRVANQTLKPCTCGADETGGRHKQPCPVYFRDIQAKRRARLDAGN